MTFERGFGFGFRDGFNEAVDAKQPRFGLDLARFRLMRNDMLVDMFTRRDGAEYPVYDLTPLSPFSHRSLGAAMLRDQGVRISFSNPGEPIPSLANPNVLLSFENSLSVGVHPEDQAIYLEVMRDYNRFGFLRFVTDSFFSKSPIEGNYATGARMAADAFSDLGAEQRDTLLKRGFMTSHLLVHLKPSRPLGNLGYGDTVSEYELLNRQGFTPFGSEELYGMANRLIQDSIEQRPEIADELRKRRENKNSR